MRKHAKMQPNELLLRERQRRGWTREFVAERIGIADPKTIGRWERGVSSPSAYFLQKLCDVYARSPQELGLFHEATSDEGDERVLEEVLPRESVYDPALPLPYMEMGGLVGREYQVLYLRERLCAQERVTLTALYGLPGVGKTALAVALAYDEAITRHYSDGVLWAALGHSPDIFQLLRHWGHVLGMEQGDINEYESPTALAKALRARIGTRRLLFILDDAWTREMALALTVGGPNCSYLLTTRVPALAFQFANAGAFYVSELSAEAGMNLLERLMPDVQVRRWPALRSVVAAAGGLPLALCLIGKYLQAQAYCRQPRRLQHALEYLYRADARFQLNMPRPLVERQEGEGETYSLRDCLERTTSRLDERALQTLAALSVFPFKPHSFSEEAALAVCQGIGDEATLDRLVDSGLLEVDERGRYMVHQVIADYVRQGHNPGAAYERLLCFFQALVEREAPEVENLEPEKHNILVALKIACEREVPEALTRGAAIFLPVLQRYGLYEIAEMYLKRCERCIDWSR